MFFFSPLLTSLRKENHLETLQDEGELIRHWNDVCRVYTSYFIAVTIIVVPQDLHRM